MKTKEEILKMTQKELSDYKWSKELNYDYYHRHECSDCYRCSNCYDRSNCLYCRNLIGKCIDCIYMQRANDKRRIRAKNQTIK